MYTLSIDDVIARLMVIRQQAGGNGKMKVDVTADGSCEEFKILGIDQRRIASSKDETFVTTIWISRIP